MGELKGYNGKVAYVDLSTSNVEVKDLDPKIAEDYIGGVGLSAKLMYDMLKEEDYEALKNDPLESVNPLIFATGPLTGTATPSSSRYSVSGVSPLTGFWGESTSGGYIPVALRKCGYDAIVITGEADKPKILVVIDGKIEIKDADALWGKNTHETVESLKKELNDDKIRVACIGKGGENLVKYAAIINGAGRAAGRCGFGALMGKKKLKALVVKGKEQIEFEDKDSLMKEGKKNTDAIKSNFIYNFISHYGTLCYTDIGSVIGDVPANYFTSTEFVAENLTGRFLKERYPVLDDTCAGCLTHCKKVTLMKINGKEVEVHGPEYETAAAFGPLCGISDFDPVLKAHHTCNLEGVDVISSGVSIAFLIYLVENNIGKENILKYLSNIKLEEIRWGNDKVVLKLLDQIINREGIGDILAEGVKKMAKKLEVDPGLAAHVKGLEIPMHDPRAFDGQALSYMTTSVGANHCKGDYYAATNDFGAYRGVKKGDRFNIDGREDSVRLLQDIRGIYDFAVICGWSFLNTKAMARLIKASTGFASIKNDKSIILIGERCNTLKRLISCKLGCKREDDYLPKIVTIPLESGGSAGNTLDLEENLKVYYKHRGWDWETGFPTKEKLEQLGI